MTAPVLAYLSHPVGAPDRVELEAVLGQFRQWFRFLIGLPDPACRRIAWSAPWLAYVESLREDVVQYRERGQRDALASLDSSHALVAVGRMTPWREAELARGLELGLPIVNFTALGPLPPPRGAASWWTDRDSRHVIAELGALVAEVDRRRARATP